jgi:cytochrome c oxidase cbb3-type subunit 3
MLLLTSFLPSTAFAQTTAGAGQTSLFTNPLFIGLCTVIILLLILIIALAELVKTAAYHKKQQSKTIKALKSTGLILLFVTLTETAHAQSTSAVSGSGNYWGIGSSLFLSLCSIIVFEIFIAWGLFITAKQIIGESERKKKAAEEKAKVNQPNFIEKINASVAIEKEADIMLDHNYDGIQELDNDLPPWWKYGFYLTIVFAVVYLVHYHVSNTGKLQLAEYEDEVLAGKYDADEYRKKAANLVDENNATALIDEASLQSGQTIYMDNCSACHGKAGQGGVGPNLTDAYWLHNGSIRDIFKTIKFGYPEKGMKSWQQDLSGRQIHEVSSYIKSIANSKPANPKEPQGELYADENDAADSLKAFVAKDSIK